MFERFTDRARRVVVLAQEEARMLGHNYIGTEHLLLGLLHKQSGIAARVLDSEGLTLDAARGEVEAIVGPGSKPPQGHIPFTPRAKKILELSLREALELKKSYIGTEHILLGLIREGNGVGAQVLERLGPSLSALRQKAMTAATAEPADPDDDYVSVPVPGTGTWSWPSGFARTVRVQGQTIGEFRELLASIDRRLASIDRKLANIEHRLGISAQDPEEPEESAQ